MRLRFQARPLPRRYRDRPAAWATLFFARGWVTVTIFPTYWRIGRFITNTGSHRLSLGPLEIEVLTI